MMGLLQIIIFLSVVPSLTYAQTRLPLANSLEKIMCQRQSPPSPQDLLAQGITTAQISARLFKKAQKRSAPLSVVSSETIADARRRGHLSYEIISCPDGEHWGLTFPAPDLDLEVTPFAVSYLTNNAELNCEKIIWRFADQSGGYPRLVATQQKKRRTELSLADLNKSVGILSMTCTQPRAQKPASTLWHLIPIGKLNDTTPYLPVGAGFDDNNLRKWINAVRKLTDLASLEPPPRAVIDLTSSLLSDKVIRHDRQKLKSVEQQLRVRGYRFIGEDRVIARSLTEATWLLWNSPEHRTLLLDKDADTLSMNISNVNDQEKIAVIVLSRKL